MTCAEWMSPLARISFSNFSLGAVSRFNNPQKPRPERFSNQPSRLTAWRLFVSRPLRFFEVARVLVRGFFLARVPRLA